MHFANYASNYADSSPPSFSDSSSTPRTPSPYSNDFIQNVNFKLPIESLPHIFQESDSFLPSDLIQNEAWSTHYPYQHRSSFLQESYEPDLSDQYNNDVYIDDHAHYNEWQQQQQTQLHHTAVRRATFPYVRQDLPQSMHTQYYDQYPTYTDSLPVSPNMVEQQAIKLEDTPLIVPSQLGFPAHPLQAHPHAPFIPSAAAVPVQHTDDAASKETQYLRRRCFNCHTTEPPSWRRSTLNPGKIVCNKCGLYERTHLRPRPLRFDELRAGGRTRKATGTQAEKKTTKTGAVVASPQVKNEPREFAVGRRGSVSSNASSSGAASDWDDNVSVCSSHPPTPGSTSGPSSSYSSPAISTFPIPRSSQSPPVDAGAQAPIRLPNTPLADVASLQQAHSTPRKAPTTPNYYPQPVVYQGQSEAFRRGSLPTQRNVPFASPPMPSQSPAPGQGLMSELQASPLHTSPQSVPSAPLVPEAPSS